MRNHGLLSHDAILELRSAVISAGLTESRRALLAGISPELVASLPDAAAPGAQVLTDLDALRTTGALADGSVPLATWLQNAVALSGPREEAAVFRRALSLVRGARGGTAEPGQPRDDSAGAPSGAAPLSAAISAPAARGRIPIDERLLAMMDYAKSEMARQDLRFLTPSLLLVLLDLARPVSCFERVTPGLSSALRARLHAYVGDRLPREGMPFIPFEWSDREDVRRAEQEALKDNSHTITDKHLLLGVLESGGSTIKSLKSLLGGDYPKLVQAVRDLPARMDGQFLPTPGIDLEDALDRHAAWKPWIRRSRS
ncbi:Clp protease N-terminal domain-containing protein [Sorangium sp. So ce260]|uniref:Clp protease N-terminal domain-containing protein n=1 Tax=Sorangium sp. So ce260 TaxID=3133291 RepID=UPI003F6195EA